jgi:hypothetical protein
MQLLLLLLTVGQHLLCLVEHGAWRIIGRTL